jgi:hypothetical protein
MISAKRGQLVPIKTMIAEPKSKAEPMDSKNSLLCIEKEAEENRRSFLRRYMIDRAINRNVDMNAISIT